VFIIPSAFSFPFNSKVLGPNKHRGLIFALPFHNILKNMNEFSSVQHVPLLAYAHFCVLVKIPQKSKGVKDFYSKQKE